MSKSMKDIVRPDGYAPERKLSEKTVYILLIFGLMAVGVGLFFLLRGMSARHADDSTPPADATEMIQEQITEAGQTPEGQLALAIDVSGAVQNVGYQLNAGDVVRLYMLREKVISPIEELQAVRLLGVTAYEQPGENGAVTRRCFIILSVTEQQAEMILTLETSGVRFYAARAARAGEPAGDALLDRQAQILADKFSPEALEAARKAEEEKAAQEEAAKAAAEQKAAAEAAQAAASEPEG